MSKFILKTSVEKLSGIYKITSPTKKVYIGQSINIYNRIAQYNKTKQCSQIKLYRSFNKYGKDKHTFEVLEYCDIELLNEKERYYQDLYSVIGKNGLNCSLTKSSDRSGRMSEETKRKLKERVFSEDTKRKMSIARKGVKLSDLTKEKLRNIHLGKKKTEEHKKNMSSGISKKIINTKTGEIFNSALELSKLNGMKQQTIQKKITNILKNDTDYMYLKNYLEYEKKRS